jgi:RecA/RadA recombinase
LYDELVRLDRERNDPPLADEPPPRGLAEIRRIAGWTNQTIPDDQPGAFLSTVGPASGGAAQVRLVRVSSVEPEPVNWAWSGRIALGKSHLLDGDPGLGKSTLALDLAARISTGFQMPDGSTGIGPAGVVILTAEDGIADTVRPRLEAAGADLDRIAVLTMVDDVGERPASIPDDLARVEQATVTMGARLVIVDPLMAHLAAAVNSHRDQDIRRALAPLHGLAERTGAAVVVVRHLNKTPGGNPLYRGGGSIGIVGAVRIALLVAPDPDDETGQRRVLAVAKCNLAPIGPALAFTIEPATVGSVGTSTIRWGAATGHTARQLLAAPSDSAPESGALEEAKEILAAILVDGPVPAKTAQSEARQAGVSDATLRRAKEALGVGADRAGGLGASGRWYWSLAPKMLNEPLRRSSPEAEHLRQNLSTLGESPSAFAPTESSESALSNASRTVTTELDFGAPICQDCGRRMRKVPSGVPRPFVCTFPHIPMARA